MGRSIYINLFLPFFIIIVSLLSFLVYKDNVILAGRVLTIALITAYLLSFFRDNPAEFFTMVILVFSPFMAFLRQYVISYNGTTIFLIAAILLWLPKEAGKTFKNTIFDRRIIAILFFMVGFVFYGLITGSKLERFMKFIETVLAVILFSMALIQINSVKKYFLYFIISSILIVISLLPHIETRYIFESGGVEFKADPSAYSIGLVLASFFLIEDGGHWVFNGAGLYKKVTRFLLLIVVIVLTFLTTSRIGLIALLGSYLVLFIWSKGRIRRVFPVVVAVAVSITIIMNSGYSKTAELWYNRTFNNKRGLSGASSGRIDQWKMAGNYLKTGDPVKVLFGYNPGKGPLFSKEYSAVTDVMESMRGRSPQLHSLYLNIFVEYGLIAFILFLWFFIRRWKSNAEIYKLYGISMPFLALVGYLIYIGSVSGLGIIPGMFISLFLLTSKKLEPIIQEKADV